MEFFKRTPTIDFMGKRRVTYAISAFLMVASFALPVVRGLTLGIDFTGGVVVEVSYPVAADVVLTVREPVDPGVAHGGSQLAFRPA